MRKHKWRAISASQMKTAEYSPRKWFFEKLLKLPYRRKGHFGFGTTLSECLERYLLADHNAPLDVAFPDAYQPMSFGRPEKGVGLMRWDWRLEKPKTEGPLIRQLVAEAVEKGFVRRTADAWVEFELPHVPFGGFAELWGYGDLAYPDDNTILDHKSTKSRKWIMSRPKMKRDIQLILYAAYLLETKREKGCEPEKITVGHIAYIKDGGLPYGERVELKTVTVTPAEIDARMEEIHSLAEDMHLWSEFDACEFQRVPCGGKNCMNKFGGCPYVTICGGEETPEEYQNRFDKAASMVDTLSRRATGEARKETAMGNRLLEQLKARKKPPTATKPVAPAVEKTPEKPVAPWADAGCPSCGGSGWTAKGEPCPICVGLTDFDLDSVTITGPGEFEAASNPTPPAAEEPQETAQEPAAPEVSEPAAPPAAPPAPPPAPEKVDEAPAPSAKRGRKPVTTITVTLKTSDGEVLDRFASILERLGG
jgi:hypothetical protein